MHRTYKRIVSLFVGLGLSALLAPACSAQSVIVGSTLSAATIHYQSRPPEWAIGRFKGQNKHYFVNLDMTITSNGSVTVRVTERNGDSRTVRTSYRNGRIEIENNSYQLQEILKGIRLVQVRDPSNAADLQKFGGPGGYNPEDFGGDRDGGGRDDRPPSWAVGTFEGHNDKYDNDVIMTINSDGRVTQEITENNGRRHASRGTLRDRTMEIGGKRFTVTSYGSGMRIIQQGDRSNRVDFVRTRDSGGSDRPPSWAIGVFEGRNDKNGNDVEMTMNRDGRVTWRITERNGRAFTQRGNYRDGRIEVGGNSYRLERTRGGVVSIMTTERDNRIYFRKVD